MLKMRLLTMIMLGMLSFLSTQSAFGSFSAGYGDLYGTEVDFLSINERTDTEDHALYNTPTLVGNRQLYFPTAFVSEAGGGADDITAGVLSMTLKANEGYAIRKVKISEWGSYSLTGEGSNATSAGLSVLLTVNGETDSFSAGPYEGPGPLSGTFNVSGELDFTGLGITELDFSLSNELFTTSEDGTTAKIEKALLQNNVEVEILTAEVPIPGSLLLFGTGGGLFSLAGIRRLRKK